MANKRIPDVLVFWSNHERVITTIDGVFALPLRTAPLNSAISVTAIDQRTSRSKTQQITLPGDLDQSWTLVIS